MIGTSSCPRESDIRQASRSGRWTLALLSHAAGCNVCRDERRVAEALVASPERPPSGIEPRSIFACARRVRRFHIESRISFIVTGAQAVALAAIVGVLLSFVSWTTVWPAWILRPDRDTLIYATAGLAIAAALGMSRWLSHEN